VHDVSANPLALFAKKVVVQPFLMVTLMLGPAGRAIRTLTLPADIFCTVRGPASIGESDNLIVTGLDTAISQSPPKQAL
jgi:hypothetical protein